MDTMDTTAGDEARSRYRLGSHATKMRLLDTAKLMSLQSNAVSQTPAEGINYDEDAEGGWVGDAAAHTTKQHPGMEHVTQLLFVLCTGTCTGVQRTTTHRRRTGLVISVMAVLVSESIAVLVRLRNSMLLILMQSGLNPGLRAAMALIALSTLSVVLVCAAAAMVCVSRHVAIHHVS